MYSSLDLDSLEAFKTHKIKAKNLFYITEIAKNTAYSFIKTYHYLKGAKFLVKQSFGLYCKQTNVLLGVAAFSPPQGINTLRGWFSLNNQDKSIYELSRLVVVPELNGSNATSFLLGSSLRALKKQRTIRAIIALADSSKHVGSIYQICNFGYYGLTKKELDFYLESGGRNLRGPQKTKRGVYIPRTRKHRYCYLLDKNLHVNYNRSKPPIKNAVIDVDCCKGTKKVFDRRFNAWYTCPICTGKLELINNYESKNS